MNDPQIFMCGLIVGTLLGMGWGYAAGIMSKLRGERDDE